MIHEHLTVTGISKATHSDVNKQTKKTREVVPSGTIPIPSVAGESGCSGGAQLKTPMQPLHGVVNNASWKVLCILRFHWNHYEETKY